MTAPASLPALIAEGRRLIAEATPGLAVACYETEADGSEGRPIVCLGQDHSGPLMSSDSTQGLVCLTTEDRDRFVFAVNNLAALLDVAEAAAAMRTLLKWLESDNDRHFVRDHACGVCVPDGDSVVAGFLCGRHAYDSALSRLRGVRT